MNKEILWNIINSLLAGGLVFLGALSTGQITTSSVLLAVITASIVAVTQFKDYWNAEKPEYCGTPKLFSFITP